MTILFFSYFISKRRENFFIKIGVLRYRIRQAGNLFFPHSDIKIRARYASFVSLRVGLFTLYTFSCLFASVDNFEMLVSIAGYYLAL